MLEYRQLKHFLAIIRSGNFRKAANELHITPPALTKSIHQLEDRLGVELFDREYGSAKPTVFGRVLEEHARSLVASAEDIENHIAQIANLENGRLSVGGGIIASETKLRRAVINTSKNFPKLKFDIVVDNWSILEKKLVNGDIELYVGRLSNISEFDDIEIIELSHDPLFLICGADHPLLKIDQVTVDDIIQYPFISSFIPEYAQQKILECLGEGYSAQVPHMSCNSFSFARSTIRESHYISIGTTGFFHDDLTSGGIVRVPINLEFGVTEPRIAYMRSRLLSPAAKQLIKELKKSL